MAWTTQQRREAYRRKRRDLIARMGGRCLICGATKNLEFHHPNGRTWDPARVNRLQRLRLYEADWRAGRCVLACRSCNGQRNGKGSDGPG